MFIKKHFFMFEENDGASGANNGGGISGAEAAAAALAAQGKQPASGASQAANPENPAGGSSAASSAASQASSSAEPAGSQAAGSQAGTLTLTQEQLNDRIRRATEHGKKLGQQAQKDEQTEAEKLAGMSAQQRLEYQNNKLTEELAKMRSENSRNAMISQARVQLTQDGVQASDEILGMIVTEEAESTMANVASYTAAVKASAEAMFAKQRQGSTPANGNGGGQNAELSNGAKLAQQQKEANKASQATKSLFTR